MPVQMSQNKLFLSRSALNEKQTLNETNINQPENS